MKRSFGIFLGLFTFLTFNANAAEESTIHCHTYWTQKLTLTKEKLKFESGDAIGYEAFAYIDDNGIPTVRIENLVNDRAASMAYVVSGAVANIYVAGINKAKQEMPLGGVICATTALELKKYISKIEKTIDRNLKNK